MKNIEFVPKAFDEYRRWVETDRKIAIRISDLIRETIKSPFDGLGKPEPLKYEFKGYWSRRIDQEHRLIYRVTDTSIIIFSCFSHYQ
jgi:toxin YoeB